LLQQIAQWALNEVEKVTVIWVSLSSLEGKTIEEYLLKRWLKDGLQVATVTQEQEDSFVDWFTKSQIWLLLDGVDEMPSGSNSSPLQSIANQTTGWISQARIFITCRINLWDSRVNPLDMFDAYRMLDLSYPKQVEQFIECWFLPQGYLGIAQGYKLCKALKEPGIERIRDLIKNPLRLTLLCFNFHLGDGKLPETKAELYQQFMEDFYELKQSQFPTTIGQRNQLNSILGELSREAIDKELSRFCLRQDFIIKFMGEPDDEISLFHLSLKLGWLNKVGVDATNPRRYIYAFLHPTFQEYFAALAIDDWHFFLNHNNENPNPNLDCDSLLAYNNGMPLYRIFNPEWRGTIILWIGLPSEQVSKSIKEDFIISLRGFESGIDSFSYFTSQAIMKKK
jgi:predicted NACHT family NTPase